MFWSGVGHQVIPHGSLSLSSDLMRQLVFKSQQMQRSCHMVHSRSMMAHAHVVYLGIQRHVCTRSGFSGISVLVRAIQVVHPAQSFFGQL
ncbi:hypothetical protein BJX66DRAFT_308891 [Aspergillus keveii]|uniref:Uncharacterized protein n=1 Tax=Aspergillus keveii TaxID=714993 RepID=A0ABR4FYW9_9EURO